MANRFTLKSIQYDGDMIIKSRGLDKNGKVQQFIDSEVIRYCDPLIPKDTGALIESGHINTVIGSGEVRWQTPYARRWYYMPAMFQGAPQRGNYWFERMKQEKKDTILNGAKKISGGK